MDKIIHNSSLDKENKYMFKIYSKGCEYAIRILSKIPRNTFDQKHLAVDLCKNADVPVHSARKVLQLLVDKGFLEGATGPGGGYRFKRDPDSITLFEIIAAVDGKKAFDRCVMGLPQCSSKNPCPAHNLWLKVKVDMVRQMDETSILKMMSFGRKGKS